MKDEIFLASMVLSSELNNCHNERRIFKKKSKIIKKLVLFFENNLFAIMATSLGLMLGKEVLIVSTRLIQEYFLK